MNDDTPDRDTVRHDATGDRIAEAFARRAAAATLPPPDLEHLRELAGQRPAPARPRSTMATRGLAAAAAAVVLAAGSYVVLEGRAGTPPVTSPGVAGPGVSTADLAGGASVVLRRIADTAAAEPATVPRPDQFVYTRMTGEGIPKGGPEGDAGTPQRLDSETWTAQAPGTDSLAVYGNGERVPISSTLENDPGKLSEMPTYADLAELPTDPAALRSYLNARLDGPFDGARLLLQGNLVPPALASALYRVLADEPGLTVDPDAVDAAGRHGIGITETDRTGARSELLFDDDGRRLLGTRLTGPTGQLESSVAVVEQSIVDEVGRRPS